MSETEKHTIIGKAVAELSAAQKRAKMLEVSLRERAATLREAATVLDQFAGNPSFRNLSGMRLSVHVGEVLTAIPDPDALAKRVGEFEVASDEVVRLQALLDSMV